MKEANYIRECIEAVMSECAAALANLAELEAKVEDMEAAAKAEAEAEADTQELIYAGACKGYRDYWDCWGSECNECPAARNGKDPRDRYEVGNCERAQRLDLLRRQRELDAKVVER